MNDALPVIGVLGGMGPAATADFFSKLVEATPATRDQEHLPVLICSVPQIPDRATAYLHGGPSPESCLVHYARTLQTAGASILVIPCNTAHIWYEAIASAVTMKVMHIADAVLDVIDTTHTGGSALRIGLLGTTATVRSGLYERRSLVRGHCIEWVVPNRQTQDSLVTKGIAAVKAGSLEEGRQLLEAAACSGCMRGVDKVVLACTEIPLVLGRRAGGVAALDATLLLAEATVKEALRQTLPRPAG